jgi:RHS repeat-associated protein
VDYHGLVKTFVGTPVYYYQDELGSTSHIANSTGGLVESYQYNLYGKPKVYDASGQYQQNATPQAKDLGNGGARWIPELALYDDRNRFMSPDLGRFIQPDPIGFKGDASNLYRYCGNDWANRTDPTGLASSNDPADLPTNQLQQYQLQQKQQQLQKQIAHEQGILNDKLALGYGATQLAGNFQKINQLQDMKVGMTNQTSGQFTVSAQPVSLYKGGIGASGSSAVTEFTTNANYSSFEVRQEKAEGTLSNGKMRWGNFGPDNGTPGLKPMKITQQRNGVRIEDKPGHWQPTAYRSGSQIAHHGSFALDHFDPFGQKIRTSIYGDGHFLGSHTWGAEYQEGRLPVYQGVGGPFGPDF